MLVATGECAMVNVNKNIGNKNDEKYVEDHSLVIYFVELFLDHLFLFLVCLLYFRLDEWVILKSIFNFFVQ